MKKTSLAGLLALFLSGCAVAGNTSATVPVQIANIPAEPFRIASASLRDRDGALTVCGTIRKLASWHLPPAIHLDARFLNPEDRLLARRSIGVELPPPRRFANASVAYEIPAAPWPEGTAKIIVSGHRGATHADDSGTDN